MRNNISHALRFLLCVLSLVTSVDMLSANAAERASLSAQDVEDIKYIAKLAEKNKQVSGPLDFSDPVQYRFYVRQSVLSGATQDKYPQFFRELEATRKRHIAQKGIDRHILEARKLGDASAIAVNVVSGFGAQATTQQNFVASALSSTPGGSENTRLTLQLLDANYNPLGPNNQHTEFAQGENTQVSAPGSFPSPTTPNAKRPVYITGTYNYQPYGGTAQHGYLLARSDSIPQSISNQNPIKHGGNVAGTIRVCLNRSGTDCDITENTGSQQNVIFPIQGSVTYFDAIQTPFTNDNSFSSTIITKEQSGGGCIMAESHNFFQTATVSADQKTLSWNIDPASFGAACFNQADSVVYSFTVQVTVGTGNDARPVFAYITSASNATPDLNTATIMPIQFRWGCLAGESEITVKRKGGFEPVPIKDVKIGDVVLANGKGDLVEVIANTIGTEPIPMIRIKTKDGKSLLVTNGHPVVTARGVVLARHLKPGDVLFKSDSGHTPIAAISSEMYKSQVWSLDVATVSTGGRSLDQDGTTFYANGLLVGDVKMQNRHERLARQDKRTVLERLPKKWHQDYLNHLANN
ncbi:MAG: hypothetical protein EPN26_00410 [Rhodospirillales bacterium]|nr:MAG: hypothetical protein EPN26_00410 [Rhodospirillales bacterium]